MIDTFTGELNLAFFADPNFEEIPAEDSAEKDAIIARNALRILMMGWSSSWQEMISLPILKAIFVERNRGLMRGMREAFQIGFRNIYEQLVIQTEDSQTGLTPQKYEQAQLYLSNCLSLLPFSDINPYESISIPQWINGQWQLIEYHVTPIELTPTSGFRKLFLEDEDRVFAYGLEPINSDIAESHLIFMGTTYPAGQGFVTQVATDLKGFNTVGNSLYQSGRKQITKWLDKQNQVHVCGLSLGGSLSLLLALDQGNKLSRVDSLNPAGLYDFWIKGHIDNWDNLERKPEVVVQKQGNDPVSAFGVWKNDWNIWHVVPPREKQGPNGFIDHALNYAGFAETQFEKVNPEVDNKEHHIRNFWLYRLGRGLAYYFGIVPYRYLLLPCIRYAKNHKTQLTITVALFLLFCFLPVPSVFALSVFGLSAIFLNALLFSMTVGLLVDKTLWLMVAFYNSEHLSDFFKKIIPMEKTRILIAFGIESLLVGIGVTTLLILGGPAAFPLACLISISLPLIFYATYKLSEAISTIRGEEKVSFAACHDPFLSRNQSLDMYANQQQQNFSLQELQTYYYAKRVLVKEKPLIPNSNDTGREKFGGMSKKEILEESMKIGNSETKITVTATKAKIFDIRRTLKTYNLNFFTPREALIQTEEGLRLIEQLKEEQDTYAIGKSALS